MKRQDIPFSVFTPKGILKQFAEVSIVTRMHGGQRIYFADREKRLGFELTAHDARCWAKALTEAADALEAQKATP